MENTSYSQKLHIPASPSDRESLPSIPDNVQPPFPVSTCHNQEFRIRCCIQIPLTTSDSWSFLPIPELPVFLGWLSDHLLSMNKCKAEFLHFCTSGIGRKCRNSCTFLPIPELQKSLVWLSDHSVTLDEWIAECRN
jgi:hypothetical protein